MSYSLANFLPSELPTAQVPYDFTSSSSTESDSDDDEITGLTRRFTRSVSFQERLKLPYPVEKRGLNWNASVPTQVRSSPTTPFGQTREDSWELIYAAAREVARMKINTAAVNDAVLANRGLLGAPLSNRHYLPNRAIWSQKEAFFRQHLFRRRVAGGTNYDCGGRCGTAAPSGFRQSAWPPLPVSKPVPGGRISVVKKERSGTGVFLPRSYGNIPPEMKKTSACSHNQLPAVFAQPFNKNMGPIIPQPQCPQYQVQPSPPHHFNREALAELVTARLNAVMLAKQRPETRMGPPEVVLPQDWTY
ncbi:hypothetical protein L1987_75321 [Smallanthus sonchifolius]|uniref:Uncharacterized protein n=1 Tax=Smallanthus sonchifolius TaxID=185202 RepID=A0ACB9A4E4_9ASTR|nr:hypothetical protein L1987_75321 [Smallanthus sonchifolius]